MLPAPITSSSVSAGCTGCADKNFVKAILRLAGERETVRSIADQFGAPAWARLVADTPVHAVRQSLNQRATGHFVSGVFNLTASGQTSWHGFAKAIVADARQYENNLFAFRAKLIQVILTEKYPLPAVRPRKSRLCWSRLARHFVLVMPSWQTCLSVPG